MYIEGCAIDSLNKHFSIDEKSVDELFDFFDKKGVFFDTIVLNAADQELDMKIFENSAKEFMKVLNTNLGWNYVICHRAAKRMKEKEGKSLRITKRHKNKENLVSDKIFYTKMIQNCKI